MTKQADEADEAGDPVLRSMRSVWVSMRDEDPPQRGMADLLAAARVQAEAMQPKDSWWRRTVSILWRPPVLAMATMVVLVGGAIVVNNRSKDLEVAATQELARESARGVANAPERLKDEALVRPDPEPARPGAASPVDTIVTEAPRNPKPPRAPRPETPTPKQQIDTKSAEGNDLANAAGPEAEKRDDVKTGDKGGLMIADEGTPTEPTADAAAPPPPTRPGEVTRSVQGRSSGDLVEQLVKQTEVAAGRKDCPAVRATAERLKKLDSTVYKTRVAKQPAVASCLR